MFRTMMLALLRTVDTTSKGHPARSRIHAVSDLRDGGTVRIRNCTEARNVETGRVAYLRPLA